MKKVMSDQLIDTKIEKNNLNEEKSVKTENVSEKINNNEESQTKLLKKDN